MKQGRVFIVGAGDFSRRGFSPGPLDLVIAADAGLAALWAQGIPADLVIGDMDSLKHLPRGQRLLRFPKKKDDSDLALAIRLAYARGYRKFLLYGALGGHLDHGLANLQLMAGLARKGAKVRMIAPDATVYAVSKDVLHLPLISPEHTVSVFAVEQARGVRIRGLAYELEDASLEPFLPLGLSNQGRGTRAIIQAKEGTLLVFVLRRNG